MDPNLVRQQEEEEAASLLRNVFTGRAPFSPPKPDPLVLRAEPRDIPKPPSFPSPTAFDDSDSAPGWGAALQATLYSLLFVIIGLVGGIILGARLGLVSWQSLALGMIGGFLLGWRSAVAALGKRYAISTVRAYRASLIPTLIILCSLVGSFASILSLPGASSSAAGVNPLTPWLISLIIGAAVGFALALPKMFDNLRA